MYMDLCAWMSVLPRGAKMVRESPLPSSSWSKANCNLYLCILKGCSIQAHTRTCTRGGFFLPFYPCWQPCRWGVFLTALITWFANISPHDNSLPPSGKPSIPCAVCVARWPQRPASACCSVSNQPFDLERQAVTHIPFLSQVRVSFTSLVCRHLFLHAALLYVCGSGELCCVARDLLPSMRLTSPDMDLTASSTALSGWPVCF